MLTVMMMSTISQMKIQQKPSKSKNLNQPKVSEPALAIKQTNKRATAYELGVQRGIEREENQQQNNAVTQLGAFLSFCVLLFCAMLNCRQQWKTTTVKEQERAKGNRRKACCTVAASLLPVKFTSPSFAFFL